MHDDKYDANMYLKFLAEWANLHKIGGEETTRRCYDENFKPDEFWLSKNGTPLTRSSAPAEPNSFDELDILDEAEKILADLP